MLVEIDVDQLVRDAATGIMDAPYAYGGEKGMIVDALQKQLPEDYPILKHIRNQVKEYKKLTMWRD